MTTTTTAGGGPVPPAPGGPALEMAAGGRRLLPAAGGRLAFWTCPAGAAGDPFARRAAPPGGPARWDLSAGWAAAVHPGDLERCRATHREAAAAGRPFELEYRLRLAGGGHGRVHDSALPCLAPDGTFAGYVGTCADVTGERREQDRRRLLVDVFTALDTGPSLGARLRLAGHVLVPEFAARCVIEPPAPARPLVVAGGDAGPDDAALTDAAVRRWLREAWTRRHTRVPAPPERGPGRIAVPLSADGRMLGTLRLERAADAPPYDAADHAFAEEAARRMAAHLDYARLLYAERAARARAEVAAGRTARMQRLAAALSSALTADQVAAVIARHARAAASSDARATVLEVAGAELRVMACTGPGHTGPDAAAVLPVARPYPAALAAMLDRPRPFWAGAPAGGSDACPACPPLPRPGVAALLTLGLAGETMAVLSLGLPPGRALSADERADLTAVADLGAQALGRARRFDAEQRVAGALQQNLLPEALPEVPGTAACARYRPAAGDRFGGDWYDLVPVDGDRVAVAVGDVSGHGIGATATMSRIRGALSAYLAEGHSPGRALALTSALTRALPPETIVTVCCALIDPAAGTLEYANAGHPPPLLRAADGAVTPLDAVLDTPLGVVPGAPCAAAGAAFPPGATLLLYTDGLVERRGEHLGTGLARLSAALGAAARPLEPLADALLAATAPGGADDVTLLLVRATAGPPAFASSFTCTAEALSALRGDLARWLAGAGAAPDDVHTAVLACGEAVANAAEHGYGFAPGPVEVEARLDGRTLRLRVADNGRWQVPRSPDGGRGLAVMRALMDAVDVAPTPAGTTVTLTWELSAPA
ncbi:SpoIIE family protein phosphatase [Actinomadura parmotrematis]|uniref:SpoIIE family protein phosphatase n=1 Tax=Actinomadura parmotrematis TaxID=2864039 RepID=A0ABS7G4K1_9ACTN|nr:SpoIIE family protein phosphatase [Actinomadura parmotrematis]MBW8487155.1 SpoIIE family protein phosphatase [Actinomadura parmotrematis]